MKKVMVFGTFDLLHKGHLDFLKQARRYGDVLVAVVGRKSTVAAVKGRHPIHGEKTRIKNIVASGLADKVVLGRARDKYRVIEQEKPDVICLGYDQDSFTSDLRKELAMRKIKARIVRLKPYMAHKYKSSKLRNDRNSRNQKRKSRGS